MLAAVSWLAEWDVGHVNLTIRPGAQPGGFRISHF
jgi:hypothetical protein